MFQVRAQLPSGVQGVSLQVGESAHSEVVRGGIMHAALLQSERTLQHIPAAQWASLWICKCGYGKTVCVCMCVWVKGWCSVHFWMGEDSCTVCVFWVRACWRKTLVHCIHVYMFSGGGS